MENFIVKKWGGENAAELEKSPQNVVKDFKSGTKQAVVVSAIRSPEFNTTDHLIDIGNSLKDGVSLEAVLEKVETLRHFHIKIVKEKLGDNSGSVISCINEAFDEFISSVIHYRLLIKNINLIPEKGNDYSINTRNGPFSIIGFGEILSAKIQVKILDNLGLWAKSVNLYGVVPENSEKLSEKELFLHLSKEISNRVRNIVNLGKVSVIPGYIPGFTNGIENAIGRGYSDATAGIVSVGMAENHKVSLEIQKSVLGMLSGDPRIVENAKIIRKIDYLTAKEITGTRGAQAKLLHDQVLRRELQEAGIDIKLFDPFSGDIGTLISKDKDSESSGIEFVGGKEVVLFTASSGKMENKGILTKIFGVVKDYASVDVVSTSETEVSFTIDSKISKENLDEMAERISQALNIEKDDGYENFVRYKKSALIFCIGQNIANEIGVLQKITTSLSDALINIDAISQGATGRAIAILVSKNYLKDAIQVLHKNLIEQKGTHFKNSKTDGISY